MPTPPRFIRIGDEIINLSNLVRVERGSTTGETTVLLYFTDDDRSDSRFTGAQAEAIWAKFCEMAETWEVPEPQHVNPAGPGRTNRPT